MIETIVEHVVWVVIWGLFFAFIGLLIYIAMRIFLFVSYALFKALKITGAEKVNINSEYLKQMDNAETNRLLRHQNSLMEMDIRNKLIGRYDTKINEKK